MNKAETNTALASSANPSVFGQSVTFTATVSVVAPGSGTPTGTVTFKDGATVLGTGTLSGGVATFTTSSLNVASHAITAEYGADANFNGSTSSAVTQVVDKADTTTALVSSVNPSVFGQSVTFTATVSAVAPGSGTPTGTVTFKDGATVLGTGTLSGGVATFTTSSLNVASHAITAVYGADANFNGSTSSAVTQVVNKADTTTALVSSVNPSVFGQSVTFTATVSAVAPGSGTPTGTVTFMDGATTLGTGTLSSGVATFATAVLSVASHSITAVYGADGNFNGSTSSAVTQVVNKADTTTTLASSVNPSVFGQSVTLTATVAPVAPASGNPTGTITFKDGATVLGTGTLSGGVATFTTSSLNVASHSITAVYGADANFNGSTSSAVNQAVNKADTATVLASGVNPSFFGQSVTFTATVSVVAPGAGTPTGTVTFMDGATTLGTATLSGNQATLSTSALSVATHPITAIYSGDGNFNISTSSSLSQVVNKADTHTVITSSANPALLSQSVTFTATLSVVAPGAGTPTGIVTFLDGATALGTGTLSGNQATFTTSNLSLGSHNITASYGSDGNFNGSSGNLTEQVNYGFIGLLDPYAPPSIRTYKVKSAIPLKWQYTDTSGHVVNSYFATPPTITINPYPCAGGSDLAPITLDDAGASGYQYDFTTNTWQFNWKTTGLGAGCYNIYIKNSQSNQQNGPFPIQLSR